MSEPKKDTRRRDGSNWEIRGVPTETREKISTWAKDHKLTNGEALTQLIDNQLEREDELRADIESLTDVE